MRWSENEQAEAVREAERLIEAGDLDRGLMIHERAEASHPDDPVLLTYRGAALRGAGQTVAAEDALRRAVTLDRSVSHSWYQLGTSREDREEFEEAASRIAEAAALRPNKSSSRSWPVCS